MMPSWQLEMEMKEKKNLRPENESTPNIEIKNTKKKKGEA